MNNSMEFAIAAAAIEAARQYHNNQSPSEWEKERALYAAQYESVIKRLVRHIAHALKGPEPVVKVEVASAAAHVTEAQSDEALLQKWVVLTFDAPSQPANTDPRKTQTQTTAAVSGD